METKDPVEALRALARQVQGWLDERGKAGEIVCGRDRDHLTFLLTTKNAFERVYVALLLDHGHAAEAFKQVYDAIVAALSQSEIGDPQGWADTVLSSCGDLMLRCHGLAKEMEAEAVRGVSGHLTREGAVPERPLPLSRAAGLIYEKLLTLKPHQAMLTSEIQDWYESETGKNLDEGTWKNLRKEMEPHGLQNRPRVGYYIGRKMTL